METRKAGVLIGLENRDVLLGVLVRSQQSPPISPGSRVVSETILSILVGAAMRT